MSVVGCVGTSACTKPGHEDFCCFMRLGARIEVTPQVHWFPDPDSSEWPIWNDFSRSISVDPPPFTKKAWLTQSTSKKRIYLGVGTSTSAGGGSPRLVEDDSALPCGCFKRSRPRSDVPGLDKKRLGLLRSWWETMTGSLLDHDETMTISKPEVRCLENFWEVCRHPIISYSWEIHNTGRRANIWLYCNKVWVEIWHHCYL